MNPVAFSIGGIEIRWYGILIALAMAIGVHLAVKEAKKYPKIGEDKMLDFLLWMLPIAIIGARIYYVIFEWSYYSQNLSEIINLRQGGLAIHGGIIASVLFAIFYSRKRNMPFWQITDLVAPSLILGQAIGRWGNFTNGEAHGGPTDLPWAITVMGEKVHPTFLYESLWDIGVFVILYCFMRRKKEFDGQLFAIYLMGYSLGRLWIEGLRTDSLMLGPLRVAQLVSIIMIILGFIIYRKRKRT